jgi:hypothetical protein
VKSRPRARFAHRQAPDGAALPCSDRQTEKNAIERIGAMSKSKMNPLPP